LFLFCASLHESRDNIEEISHGKSNKAINESGAGKLVGESHIVGELVGIIETVKHGSGSGSGVVSCFIFY